MLLRLFRAIALAGLYLAAAEAALSQTGTVGGTVVTEGTRAQVPSAQVLALGTTLGTVTDANGRFRLTGLSGEEVELEVRRLGFRPSRARARVGDLDVSVVLSEKVIDLEEIVTTGTPGAVAKRELGNAVSRIDAAEVMEKAQVNSLQELLNGRAAGVVIQPASGAVGSGARVRVRGSASFSLSNEPLIYIDGVRVNNQPAGGPENQAFGSRSISRLNDINPEDIESIEILKGPAAATLYGTEASNGVINILTKKGMQTGTRWNLTVKNGVSYLKDPEGRFETNYQVEGANIISLDIVEKEKAEGRNIFQTGQLQEYDLNVQGGSSLFRYFLAAGMEDSEGAEPTNALRRQSGRANFTFLPGSKFNMALNLGYTTGLTKLSAEAGFGGRVWSTVLANPLVINDPVQRGFHSGTPEQYDQLYHFDQTLDRLTGSVQLNHIPFSWLQHRLTVGRDRTAESNVIFFPRIDALRTSVFGDEALGYKEVTDRTTTFTTFDYAATGSVQLTPEVRSATSVGAQYYRQALDSVFAVGSVFPTPGLTAVSATTTDRANAEDFLEDATVGFYIQELVGWRDRLFLTGALRADDNSAFGKNFDKVYYPKFSVSWIVSDEPFWSFPFVGQLKLRAAYGESGKQPQTYAALRTFVPATGPGDSAAATPQFIGNPDLGPERGKEIELGFDASLFQDRLGLELSYYNKRTVDAILDREIAPSIGFSGFQPFNAGEIRNSGVELLATVRPISRATVDWDFAVSVATNDNEVVSLGAPRCTSAGVPAGCLDFVGAGTNLRHQVGFPVGSWFHRRIVSADLSPAGVASNVMCDNGAGGSIACAQAPFVFLGRTTPDLEGSVSNTLTLWKRLRLYAFVDFKRGHRKLDGNTRVRCTFFGGRCRENFFPQEFDPRRIAAIQSNRSLIDFLIDDASFTKLREVSASYTLPDEWASYLRASRATFTIAGRNLHTWTNYGGLEPEAMFLGGSRGGNHSAWEQTTLPQLTQWVASVNVNF